MRKTVRPEKPLKSFGWNDVQPLLFTPPGVSTTPFLRLLRRRARPAQPKPLNIYKKLSPLSQLDVMHNCPIFYAIAIPTKQEASNKIA
jgi:hypothetical protein